MAAATSKTASGITIPLEYETSEVSRLVGVSPKLLDAWSRRDLIKPSIRDGTGSGRQRVYSFRDLICLRVAVECRRIGVGFREIGECLEQVRARPLPRANEQKILIRSGGYPFRLEDRSAENETTYAVSLQINLWLIMANLIAMIHLRQDLRRALDEGGTDAKDRARTILEEMDRTALSIAAADAARLLEAEK